MSIKPLNKETIKLINSTQVISSIYSAVKELVENSLDAQAQNIEVNLVDNGLSLIEVKDNGTGISREDAPFMALPSYTSKISDFNDLDLLSTYGFRGEGLTSICQVSDVTVCTKTVDDETLICYTLDNEGNVITSELSHGLTGTTVQMRNLFKNMPVRRNVLNNKKRINQEIKATEILLKTYAICKPSIRFMFRVNSNIIFNKPSCKNVIEAVKTVLGVQIFTKLTSIKKEFSQTKMDLFIPKAEIKDCTEVSQVGYQFICVNDRPIKAKEIEKKIIKRISENFSQNVSNSRKFMFCLILKVDTTMLDVNLEPNKDKVFLQNEANILEQIDKSLLAYYELPDSQISTQSDSENLNLNANVIAKQKENQKEKQTEKQKEKEKEKEKTSEREDEREKEKEWPACKKRKIISQNDNILDITTINKNVLTEKHIANEKGRHSDSFLKSISGPVLSDSDSNDAEEFLKKNQDKINNEPEKMDISESGNENSEIFDFAENVPLKKEMPTETLSQLPIVDLGDDFDWQEIVNRSSKTSKSISDFNERITHEEQINNVMWSKGQVPGLQSGIVIGMNNKEDSRIKNQQIEEIKLENSESFDYLKGIQKLSEESICNESEPVLEVPTFDWNNTLKNENKKKTPSKSKRKSSKVDLNQTKIPFAGDNACLSVMGPSAFAMYCANMRAEIVKKNPEFTPAEVAAHLNKLWKEISPEEREYYRDLANQNKESLANTTLTQTSKKSKPDLSEAEKNKNRKQLINMLGNMKIKKADIKNESVIMRTFAPWNISLLSLKEKFNNKLEIREEKIVVGSLNSVLWILKIKSDIFVFDIHSLHDQLNIKDFDINQINAEYVKDIVDRWFKEKDDMNIFHPLHSLKS